MGVHNPIFQVNKIHGINGNVNKCISQNNGMAGKKQVFFGIPMQHQYFPISYQPETYNNAYKYRNMP
jgi:hypothetical protein